MPSILSLEASPWTLLIDLLKERSINGFAEARSHLTSSFPLLNKKGALFGFFARVARCDQSPNSDYLPAERDDNHQALTFFPRRNYRVPENTMESVALTSPPCRLNTLIMHHT